MIMIVLLFIGLILSKIILHLEREARRANIVYVYI